MAFGIGRNLTWPVALLVGALDQGSKLLILRALSGGRTISVIPGFFDLTLVTNPGGIFGILRDVDWPVRGFLFNAVPLAAVAAMIWYGRHLGDRGRWPMVALGLILGGAVGNLVDRLRLGHVVDFLDAYIGSHHWPAFNLADSGICIGVVMFLVEGIFMHRADGSRPIAPPEST